MAGAGAKPFVDTKIRQRKVMLFSKTRSSECASVKEILSGFKMDPQTYEVAEIECRQDCNQIENYFQIICLTDRREVPQLFVNRRYIGGFPEITRMHESGELERVLKVAGAVKS